MIFSSIFFIFIFLPLTLLVYYLTPFKAKNLVLLLVSLIFYAWGEPVYVLLMLFSIGINYVSGREIEAFRSENTEQSEQKAKIAMIVTVVINLCILGFYKYFGFVMDNLNAVLPFEISYHALSLPIGISFYTFQTMSYVIDVYRKKVEAQHNLITFGAYVSMFPQLIAGPIVRYLDVERQLQHRRISREKFGDGAMWFLQGLGKKVILANNIGMVYDSILALGASETSMLTAWIGAFAYTMQIYYDFGGYSDMAIGLGKMLGFDFIKNFDYPYISTSITEFWRRWHISLSSWFKEYVYIPLGGNRCSTAKAIRNLMIVWCLTGLWHGAAWNFIFWGLYYGILLCLEKYILKGVLERMPQAVKHLYTMALVMIGWMLFAAPGMGRAASYIGTMFCVGGHGLADWTGFYYLKSTLILGIAALLCSTPLIYQRFEHAMCSRSKMRQMLCIVAYAVVFLICTAYLVNATYNPFLYFRF